MTLPEVNREILLQSRPKGLPEASNFLLREIPRPVPQKGEALIKTVWLSVDPYMRGRMDDRASYVQSFSLHQPLEGGVVGKVVESQASGLKVGDYVLGYLKWADYNVAKEQELHKLESSLAPVSTALGILGMPGMTAYFGLLEIGQPREGETVVVSGAAGAVGAAVAQIAKLKGCRVVGIAGGSAKTEYLLKELGLDAAVDYKKSTYKEELKAACPEGVDVYFDNVGGDITDQVLQLINDHARIVVCGQISMYNREKPDVGPRNWGQILVKSALVQGFIVTNYEDRFAEGVQQMSIWLQEGKLKYQETVVKGLESAPKAFIGLFSGENLGKQLVQVSEESFI